MSYYSPPGMSPSMPEPARPYGRPTGATVLAVFGICVAAFYLLSGICGMGIAATRFQFTQPNPKIDELMREPAYMAFTWISGILNLLISSMLLAGSILLLKGNRKSIVILTVYAYAAIFIQAIGSTVVSAIYIMPRTIEASAAGLRAQGKAVPPGFEQMMQIMMGVGVVMGLAFALAMPIAVLIVMGRKTVKGWLQAGGRMPASGVPLTDPGSYLEPR